MIATLRGIGTIAALELRQRVRGVAWYVLLGVFALLTFAVTAVTSIAVGYTDDPGSALYSVVVYVVLLLATLVTPALAGGAINGDREAGTLATTQVTLVSAPQIVLGKFLAAWVSSLAFLAVAVPFIIYSFVLSAVSPATVVVSLLVLIAEIAVLSAIGVGLSGIVRRPLFSVVATYLIVAFLGVGTLIAFGLGGAATQSTVTQVSRYVDWANVPEDAEYDPRTGLPEGAVCDVVTAETYTVPRFDRVWWILAANPYVVLADAAAVQFDEYGNTVDVFGAIQYGVRSAQEAPDLEQEYDECNPPSYEPTPARDVIADSTPSWFVGLMLHVASRSGCCSARSSRSALRRGCSLPAAASPNPPGSPHPLAVQQSAA